MLPEISDALPACPVETTLTLISDKWKVLILRDLLTGTKRFGELKKSLDGVKPKGVDITAAPNGSQRSADAQGLCSRYRRVLNIATELWLQPAACFGAMRDWGEAYKKRF